MHSLAREHLQTFLYAYKSTPREPGLTLLGDGKKRHEAMAERQKKEAADALLPASRANVAFAVKASVDYDGALDDESPLHEHTVSFGKGDFLHIYRRYSADWWIGRRVSVGATLGFVPTGQRMMRVERPEEPATDRTESGWASASDDLSPFLVVPSTRPILFLGPCTQNCALTRRLHAALRLSVARRLSGRVRILTTNLGEKKGATSYDSDEREMRTITALTEDLSLLLLETPFLESPADIARHPLAPHLILIKISHRKILVRLLRKTGCSPSDVAGADALNSLPSSSFDLIIEERGLADATLRICSYLEEYWSAANPPHPLLPAT